MRLLARLRVRSAAALMAATVMAILVISAGDPNQMRRGGEDPPYWAWIVLGFACLFFVLFCIAFIYILFCMDESPYRHVYRRWRHKHHASSEDGDADGGKDSKKKHKPDAVEVTVPQGYGPGDSLEVEIDGTDHKCTVPAGVYAGMSFTFDPSDAESEDEVDDSVAIICPDGAKPGDTLKVEIKGKSQRVTVPEGTHPGDTFTWSASKKDKDKGKNKEVMVDVTVPEGYSSGETVRIKVDQEEFSAQIPDGLKPGDSFQVASPRSSSDRKKQDKKKDKRSKRRGSDVEDAILSY